MSTMSNHTNVFLRTAAGLLLLAAGCEAFDTLPGQDTLKPGVPAAPTSLRTVTSPAGPSEYLLQWNAPGGNVPIDHYIVYHASRTFESPEDALDATPMPAGTADAPIQLPTDSGFQHFRVSAVSDEGVEGALSDAYVVNTTARLAFVADKEVDGVDELFVTFSTDPSASNITGDRIDEATVSEDEFAWSPNGTHVAFTADLETKGLVELYVVDARGFRPPEVQQSARALQRVPVFGQAQPTKISGELAADGRVSTLYWSPDATRVAFVARKNAAQANEVYVAPADGSSEPVKISGELPEGTAVSAYQVAWSPDCRRIAFIIDGRMVSRDELYLAEASGQGKPLNVSQRILPGGDTTGFAWSPDGSQLAVRISPEGSTDRQLFLTSSDIDENTAIAGVPVAAGDVPDFSWSPDGSMLAFKADIDGDGAYPLYVVAADGGVVVPVSDKLTENGRIVNHKWSPDSKRIAFRHFNEADQINELRITGTDGVGEPLLLSGTYDLSNLAFRNFLWSPDSTQLAFLADPDGADDDQLYVVPADGSAEPLELVALPDVEGANIERFAWSPDSTRLGFMFRPVSGEATELYVIPPDQPDGRMNVSGELVNGGSIYNFTWSPLSYTMP